jgi:hypothetical protein
MAIVRNIQNNDLYRYLGENKFRNLRTGNEGVIPDELSRETLKINMEATMIFEEYPEVENLIKGLNLKFDDKGDRNPL